MGCLHQCYTKIEVEEKWAGHSTCTVLVRRTCLDCGHSEDEWEFGDHESIGGSRMFPDDENYFSWKARRAKGGEAIEV
jgi:hypothetical protein